MSPNVFVIATLFCSVALQCVAAGVAWHCVRRAGRFRFAWICLSTALLVMVERRAMPLYFAVTSLESGTLRISKGLVPLDSLLALLISALMLTAVLGLRSLFRMLEQQADTLRQYAESDPLTGLLNRRSMTRDALREVHRVPRTGKAVSAMMVDLDHFKAINDRYGHEAGDAALVQVADVIKHHLRDVDLTARWGGEEFLVILPETDAAGAELVAERLRRSISEHPVEACHCAVCVTASVGTATLHDAGASPESALDELIRQSDHALYRAKAHGRNRVESNDLPEVDSTV